MALEITSEEETYLRERLVNFRDTQGLEIPTYMHEGVVNYIVHRVPPGSFLHAVLSNDLRRAVACADSQNQMLLSTYVQFFYSYVPAQCWGSEGKVILWVSRDV